MGLSPRLLHGLFDCEQCRSSRQTTATGPPCQPAVLRIARCESRRTWGLGGMVETGHCHRLEVQTRWGDGGKSMDQVLWADADEEGSKSCRDGEDVPEEPRREREKEATFPIWEIMRLSPCWLSFATSLAPSCAFSRPKPPWQRTATRRLFTQKVLAGYHSPGELCYARTATMTSGGRPPCCW